MSSQGSNSRLCIFEFETFINPGSISYLELQQSTEQKGAWVPLKSLSQGTQGLWNLYTVTQEASGQYLVSKQIVEIITWLTVVIIIGGFTILLVGVWMNRAKADVDTQPKTFILREESIK